MTELPKVADPAQDAGAAALAEQGWTLVPAAEVERLRRIEAAAKEWCTATTTSQYYGRHLWYRRVMDAEIALRAATDVVADTERETA